MITRHPGLLRSLPSTIGGSWELLQEARARSLGLSASISTHRGCYEHVGAHTHPSLQLCSAADSRGQGNCRAGSAPQLDVAQGEAEHDAGGLGDAEGE